MQLQGQKIWRTSRYNTIIRRTDGRTNRSTELAYQCRAIKRIQQTVHVDPVLGTVYWSSAVQKYDTMRTRRKPRKRDHNDPILKIISKEFQRNCYKTIFRKINTEEIFSNLHSLQIKTIFQEKISICENSLSRYVWFISMVVTSLIGANCKCL